jgi:hypothetical protein
MAWYDDIANTTKGNVQGLVNALRNPQDTIVNQFKQGALYKNKDALAALLQGDTAPLMNNLTAKSTADPNEAISVGMGFNPMMAGTLKVPGLQEAAKQHFGTTYFPSETGYLMDDLSRLDLSGRHQAGGYQKIANRNIPLSGQPDYLKLQRSIDHRDLGDLVGSGEGWNRMSDFMDKTGAVRYDINSGVSLVNKNKPNDSQIKAIVDDFRRKGNPLIIDVDRMADGGNLASKEFTDPTFGEVKSWLDRQFNLHGDK